MSQIPNSILGCVSVASPVDPGTTSSHRSASLTAAHTIIPRTGLTQRKLLERAHNVELGNQPVGLIFSENFQMFRSGCISSFCQAAYALSKVFRPSSVLCLVIRAVITVRPPPVGSSCQRDQVRCVDYGTSLSPMSCAPLAYG